MKRRLTADLIWNGLLVFSILGAVIWYYIPGHIDAIGSTGILSFRYFTTDSNLLIAAASLFWMGAEFRQRKKGRIEIPKWLNILRYAATSAGALTFLEVLLFMVPMAASRGGIHGALRCYEDNVLILHFTAPLMMFLSFLGNDSEYVPDRKEILLAMIPMGIYSVVYFVMVVVLRYWPDFYRFTFGGRYYLTPVIVVVMYSAAYGIAAGLRKLKAVFVKRCLEKK